MSGSGIDLTYHGDREVGPGLVDLAVNVRGPAPAWLRDLLVAGLADLAAYPDSGPAGAAIARRHGRALEEVLVTAGGAEAFTLLARALVPGVEVRRAAVVHPQFTEPEVALARAGHRVARVLLRAEDGFALDPSQVPDDADLVVVGNPTNPTSVLHPASCLRALLRPGRIVVVDEAFMDAVPGERESLAGATGWPGLVVVRSLTKTWGLAGLRAGYLLGPADLVRRCAEVQPPWSVSSLAVTATVACCTDAAIAEAQAGARSICAARGHLVAALRARGLGVPVPPAGPFVLARCAAGESVRHALRGRGFAVRRGDTFPGLGPDWLRIAVRDEQVTDALSAALSDILTDDQEVS